MSNMKSDMVSDETSNGRSCRAEKDPRWLVRKKAVRRSCKSGYVAGVTRWMGQMDDRWK